MSWNLHILRINPFSLFYTYFKIKHLKMPQCSEFMTASPRSLHTAGCGLLQETALESGSVWVLLARVIRAPAPRARPAPSPPARSVPPARPRSAPCGPERRCAARQLRAEPAARGPNHPTAATPAPRHNTPAPAPATDRGGISHIIVFHPALVGRDTFH